MMKTAERRMVLLNILCERRKDTVDNLAFELQVIMIRSWMRSDTIINHFA